jgi:hypothetical protein
MSRSRRSSSVDSSKTLSKEELLDQAVRALVEVEQSDEGGCPLCRARNVARGRGHNEWCRIALVLANVYPKDEDER